MICVSMKPVTLLYVSPSIASSKTSIKFIISFLSACFLLLIISARSLYMLFPPTPHKLRLLFYLHFHTSQLLLPDLKSICTCPREPIIFFFQIILSIWSFPLFRYLHILSTSFGQPVKGLLTFMTLLFLLT